MDKQGMYHVSRRVVNGFLAFSLSLGMALASPFPAKASGTQFSVVKEDGFPVAPGVEHKGSKLTDGTHIEAVNRMEIDPANPMVKLEVTSPKGKVAALDTVRNQAKQVDRDGYRVIGGFNMDFYNTDPTYAGIPNGLQITQGEIVTAPAYTESALTVTPEASIKLDSDIHMTASVTAENGDTRVVNAVNKPRTASASNQIFLFSSKFAETTKSTGTGIEVVINPGSAKLEANKDILGTVESVSEANNNPIPAGKFVLSASGTQAAWVKQNFTVGKAVSLKVNFDKGFDASEQAVSGGTVLLRNGQTTTEAMNDNRDRHPRTFVAVKQGKLYMYTFDGRQPGYSDGVTLAEGAEYLLAEGMETAMNVDGGGSTTYAGRLPGDQTLSILNSPSDGYERSNSNSLLVVSQAPVSELAHLVPAPKGPAKVIIGSKVHFSAKGQDKYYNGVPVDNGQLVWEADPAIGTITPDGDFTARGTVGKGKITVRSGSISQEVTIEVIDQLSRLDVSPNPAIVNPGAEQVFTAKGFDTDGNEILLSPDRLTWGVNGGIGTISAAGKLTAAGATAAGHVAVSFGAVTAEVPVNVGKPPIVVEDFEDLSDIFVSSARANSVKMDLVSRANPVRFGTHSARLSYDFSNTIGTSAAYMNFKDDTGNVGRLLDGRPSKLGVWVYGDAKNHWLRAVIQDGMGKNIPLDLTKNGELNWNGWKYVSVDVPVDTPTPIKLRQLYLVETSNANKTSGAVYFDNLRAVYSDTGEDLVGPVFSSYSPTSNKRVYNPAPEISALVKDEGKGVDAGSLSMTVDGNAVAHQFDAATGKVSYTPASPLLDGEHRIEIDAVDMAGNPALPKADWKFTVYTGPDVDRPSVQILSPMQAITTRTSQPRIAVRIRDEYTGIDTAKTVLEVDGVRSAHQYDEASNTVYFTPESPMANGTQHQARITAVDKSGNTEVKDWSFTIGSPLGQPKDSNHFQMSIIGDGGYYTAGQGQTAADILLREQIGRINQEPSELVGYTGDIVENDTPANYTTAVQNMNQFKVPYIVSIGNHEISGTNSRVNYQNTFGEPTYFYDYGNTRIVGLDSASGTITGSDSSQWPWLQDLLAKTQQNNILIFMHIPPDEVSPAGEDYNTGHGFSNKAEAQRFYDLLGAYKNSHPEKKIVVLSGDLHAYQHKTVQGVDYVITGGGGKYTHIPPENGGFYHYLNLKVDDSSISWDVIPLLDSIVFDNAPSTIEVSEQVKLKASGAFVTSSNAPITLPIESPFKVEWNCSNPDVLKVDEHGTIAAVHPGSADITVKSGWRQAQIHVVVPPSPAIEAVDKVEGLVNADMSTQQLIDAAQTALNDAAILVNALRDGEVKSTLLNRLDAAKAKIHSLQQALNLKEATAAVTEAETAKTQAAVDKAQAAIDKLDAGADKAELQNRLNVVKEIIKAEGMIAGILSADLTSVESINQALATYGSVQSMIDRIADGTDKSALQSKLLQAQKTIADAMKSSLQAKTAGKTESINPDWLEFIVMFAIREVGATSQHDKGNVQGYVMPIVKGHATGDEVQKVIEKFLK